MLSSYRPEDVLLYDPAWIDTKLPTGFWLMDSPEDVLAVQINAGLLRDSFPQEAARACEAFLMQFPYVLLVSADLNEVMELSDSLIVMHNGHIAAYFEDTADLTDAEMGEYMLGLKHQSPEEIGRVCHD